MARRLHIVIDYPTNPSMEAKAVDDVLATLLDVAARLRNGCTVGITIDPAIGDTSVTVTI